MFSDRCIDDGSDVIEGRLAVQWDCTSPDNQSWDLITLPSAGS
jgi:hypothetical protein